MNEPVWIEEAGELTQEQWEKLKSLKMKVSPHVCFVSTAYHPNLFLRNSRTNADDSKNTSR